MNRTQMPMTIISRKTIMAIQRVSAIGALTAKSIRSIMKVFS